MVAKKWEYSLAILFAICSLLILILMALVLSYGKNYRSQLLQELQNVKSAGFSMEEIPNYQFNKQAMLDYADIVERPLFFKGRRPIVVNKNDGAELVVETKAVKKIDYSLIGVIDTPKGLFSLFKNPKAGPDEKKFIRFKQGELIQGWVLKNINYDHVVIENENERERIDLTKPRKVSGVPVNRLKRPKNKRNKSNKNKSQKQNTANPFIATNPFKRETK